MEDLKYQLETYYDSTMAYLPDLIIGIVILILSWFIANNIKGKLAKVLVDREIDSLLAKFIGRIVKVTIVIIGFLLFLRFAGFGDVAAGVLGTAGVGAFIIGFAFKDIGENFLAGFILAFNRPFMKGDLVELNGEKGSVISLNMRDTHLKTYDGRDVFVPNANIIKNTLINYTIDGFIRNHVSIRIEYDADIKKAIEEILEELNEIPGILKEVKSPSVAVDDIQHNAIILNVYYWLDTFDKEVNGSKIKIEVVDRLISKLRRNGFTLPGNVVELKNYKNLELKGHAE